MATPHDTSFSAHTLDLLTFYVNEQVYGLPVTHVARIIEMVTITHLPELTQQPGRCVIEGIINVQGKAIPVMNLRRRFDLPVRSYGLHTPIILTDIAEHGYRLGLIVDEMEDVLQVPRQCLEIADAFLPAEMVGPTAAYLAGVVKIDGRIIIVLDNQALLSPIEQIKVSQLFKREKVLVESNL